MLAWEFRLDVLKTGDLDADTCKENFLKKKHSVSLDDDMSLKPGAHESYLLTAKFIRATCLT